MATPFLPLTSFSLMLLAERLRRQASRFLQDKLFKEGIEISALPGIF